MYKLLVSLSTTLFLLITSSYAQVGKKQPTSTKKTTSDVKTNEQVKRPNFYMGFGLGLDYGGIGAKVEYLPVNFLGLFGGVGYNLEGIGYNIGLSLRALPAQRFRPLLTGMYGYNAVLIIKDQFDNIKDKTVYYGFSAGVGLEVDVNRKRTNKISAQVIFPFRNAQFDKDAEKYNATYSPIAISVGFNFGT